MKKESEIDKIHKQGNFAVIDGDRQIITGVVKPSDIDLKIQELESNGYEDVNRDRNGDIVYFKEL